MLNGQTLEQATAALKLEKIEIVSDGTKAGTTLKVNGKEIKNLSSFDFDYYDSMYMPVCFRWTTRETDAGPGSVQSCTTYRLNPPIPATPAVAERSTASVDATFCEALISTSATDEALEKHERAIASENREKARNLWTQIR